VPNAGLRAHHGPRGGTFASPSDGAAQYQVASGNIYADEGSHWDVTYYTCGC
jgi:hypothetical protein